MPNSNYARGRAREYLVMRKLRSNGWVCSRSAMSHGPVDVFAAKSGRVLLIQVKSGTSRIKREEMESLKTFATEFNADAQVWSFRKRGKIQKVTISKRISRTTNKIPKAIVPEPMDTIPIQTVSSLNQSF